MKAVPSDAPRQTASLPTGPAAYIDEGSGPTIVAVHGLPGSAKDFRWLSPRIAENARIIRVDLPGFGETPIQTEPDPSPMGRARFVLKLVECLGLERPLLLGHSMGGIVACAAVDLKPDVFPGLALVSSPGLRPHKMFHRTPFGLSRWLVSRPRLGPALAPLLRFAFAQAGFRGYPDQEIYRTIDCGAATSIAEHAARVRRLHLPTLLCWCEDDALVEPEILAELAEVCPDGPRLRFATGGHNPQKSHAAELAQTLVRWQEQL